MENLKLENFNQHVSIAVKRCGFESKVILLVKMKKAAEERAFGVLI
jgi:hypothetical protein